MTKAIKKSCLAFSGRGKSVVLYHGTSSVFLPKILTEGLRSYFHDDDQIYLTGDVSEAYDWAEDRVLERDDSTGYGGDPVVLEVCVPGGYTRLAHSQNNDEHFVYSGAIPPECLKVTKG